MISSRQMIGLVAACCASTLWGDPAFQAGARPESGKYSIHDASYAYAYEMAHQFLTQGGEGISLNDFILGLKDYVDGKAPKFTKEQRADLVQYYYSELSRVKSEQLRKKSEEKAAASTKHLRYIAKQPGVSLDPQGIQYRLIREGRGPLPEDDDVILFEYTLASSNPAGKGDGTKYGAKTCSYKCGSIEEGWMALLKRMREGSEYEIYVPREFDPEARNPYNQTTPPEVAVYKVKVLSIKPYENIEY